MFLSTSPPVIWSYFEFRFNVSLSSCYPRIPIFSSALTVENELMKDEIFFIAAEIGVTMIKIGLLPPGGLRTYRWIVEWRWRWQHWCQIQSRVAHFLLK